MRRRRKHLDDLERELRAHLDLEAEELADPHAARRAFGNITAVKEVIHEMSRWNTPEQFAQDLRYGARLLGRSPAFSIVAILTLALGIGANTAIFSVVDAVLLRPLPFAQPHQLVRIWEAKGDSQRNVVNPLNFADWRDRSHSFQQMAVISNWTFNITGGASPVAVSGLRVSPEFFSVLRVDPAMGRTFAREEETPGRGSSVILSDSFWRSYFGADRGIVGRKIMLDGAPATVAGVLPAGFHFPHQKAELYVPFAIDRHESRQGGRYATTIARLKPGVSIAQAQQEMTAIAQRLSEEFPKMNKDWSATVVPFLDDVTENVRLPLLVLLAAVGLVLLIACANVANLLLMRANGRLREIALRAALGASRRRILQQLLSESLLLALAGWAGGLAVGYWALHGLLALIPESVALPRMESIHLDGGVFLFALGISLVTAILFGLAPAIQISRPQLRDALQQGSQRTGVGGSRVFRRAFVVAEIALALLLLVGAGLLMRSFARLTAVNPGFSSDRLLTISMSTSPAKYFEDQKRSQYLERVLEEVRRVPGVEDAAPSLSAADRNHVGFLLWARARSRSRRLFSQRGLPDRQPRILPGHGYAHAQRTRFRRARPLRHAPSRAGQSRICGAISRGRKSHRQEAERVLDGSQSGGNRGRSGRCAAKRVAGGAASDHFPRERASAHVFRAPGGADP